MMQVHVSESLTKKSLSIRVPKEETAVVLASPERVTHYKPGNCI